MYPLWPLRFIEPGKRGVGDRAVIARLCDPAGAVLTHSVHYLAQTLLTVCRDNTGARPFLNKTGTNNVLTYFIDGE